MENIEVQPIAAIIERVRVHFLTEKKLNDYQEINCGWCDLFAAEVLFQLKDHDFHEIDSHEVLILENEEEDYGILNGDLIKERFNLEVPLSLSNVEIGYHVWITNGNRHFDAECPLGVENLLDLPFFQRYGQKKLGNSLYEASKQGGLQ